MRTMTGDTHVDGNALGGVLLEVFGREMTDTHGSCATCGSVHPMGAMMVYRSAGDVMRCPTCGNVLVVVTTIHERTRIHLAGMRWLEPRESDRGS
jgi:ribosomal protein S27E